MQIEFLSLLSFLLYFVYFNYFYFYFSHIFYIFFLLCQAHFFRLPNFFGCFRLNFLSITNQLNCTIHTHDTHARFTCTIHMHDTHARYTCTIHTHASHARYTCTIHMHDTHARFTGATGVIVVNTDDSIDFMSGEFNFSAIDTGNDVNPIPVIMITKSSGQKVIISVLTFQSLNFDCVVFKQLDFTLFPSLSLLSLAFPS
jgi:hypothetical protein